MATNTADFLDELEELKNLENELERLKRIKAASEDPIMFGRVYLAHHFADRTPDFHREIIELLKDRSHPDWRNEDGTEKDVAGIGAPRNHSKSTLVTLCLSLWKAVFQKNRFTVIVANTAEQASFFVGQIKHEIEHNDLLREDFGDMCGLLGNYRWSNNDIVIAHYDTSPDLRPGHDGQLTYKAAFTTRIVGRGAGGSMRGLRWQEARPDFIVGDDLEKDDHVATPEQREKMRNWFNRALLPMLDPKTGYVGIVGTVLHFDSLLNNLLLQKDEDGKNVYVTRVYRAIQDDGSVLWPERFDRAKLDYIKKRSGSLAFNQEYQNNPVDEETRPFRPEWFNWYTYNDLAYKKAGDPSRNLNALFNPLTNTAKIRKGELPGWYFQGERLTVMMSVDPAISEKQEADDFVIVVVGKTPSWKIIHLDTYAEHIPFDKQIDIIGELEATWQPELTFFDGVAYQRVLRQHVKTRFPHMKTHAVDYHGVQKYVRIKTMSRPIRDGFLWLREGRVYDDGSWEKGTYSEEESRHVLPHRIHQVSYKLYKQLMEFPRSAHDDVPDALGPLMDYLLQRRVKTFSNYASAEAEYVDMAAVEYADQKRAEGKVIGGGLPDEGADYPAHIEETLPPKHERAPIPQYDKGVYRRRYTDGRGRAIVPR